MSKENLLAERKEKSQPELNVFTPFKTVAAFFPAVINNKTKNIFPKESYCDLVNLPKKTPSAQFHGHIPFNVSFFDGFAFIIIMFTFC